MIGYFFILLANILLLIRLVFLELISKLLIYRYFDFFLFCYFSTFFFSDCIGLVKEMCMVFILVS
jgi:hypothetical protein